MVLVPWNTSIDFRLPVSVWRETIEHYYPNTGWVALALETLRALQEVKRRRGLTTLDATVECAAAARPAMTDQLERADRFAAVGGLRAVPLHAESDQERHPDAVRDRLSAGLRGAAGQHL